MMILLAGAVGGFGLACILSRRTVLGVMIGTQILGIGAAMTAVLAGASSGRRLDGQVFGLLIVLGAAAQLAGGYALAIRLFYQRARTDMEELRSMRR